MTRACIVSVSALPAVTTKCMHASIVALTCLQLTSRDDGSRRARLWLHATTTCDSDARTFRPLAFSHTPGGLSALYSYSSLNNPRMAAVKGALGLAYLFAGRQVCVARLETAQWLNRVLTS